MSDALKYLIKAPPRKPGVRLTCPKHRWAFDLSVTVTKGSLGWAYPRYNCGSNGIASHDILYF